GTVDGVKTVLISVPNDAKTVVIPETVTSIYKGAFEGCSQLTQVTIPGTVKEIGEGAFKGCSKLTTVNIEEGVTDIAANVFDGCDQLKAIVLPSTITKVDEAAFAGSSVEKVLVPEAIAQKVTLPSTVETVAFPEGVVPVVENGYVYGTVNGVKTTLISVPTDATDVKIPSTVTTIYKGAFEGCSQLTQVTIPASVTEIGEGAFKGCSNLTSVTLEGSKNAGNLTVAPDAFDDAPLKELVIDRNTEGTPFAGKEELKTVTIGQNKTTILGGEFTGTGITDITVPATVTEIGEGAFKGCSNLKEVVLEGNETAGSLTVGKDAFDGTNVETLYQNRNTEGAPFSGNENLKNVTIGENVTELKKGEFEGSDNITDITFEGTTPPTVPDNTFDKTVTDNVTPKVPDEAKEKYEQELENSFKEVESVGAVTATQGGITYKVESKNG
ncbi:MAG: leucine-rich repeat domain-containing protein, partial [Muribaculaceae bacterium]|nr:leucine-rich repeat domain-containing protein [Muribaculaceae bacterium]